LSCLSAVFKKNRKTLDITRVRLGGKRIASIILDGLTAALSSGRIFPVRAIGYLFGYPT